jgi:mannose-1-phosphate guanylyltransferase
MNANVISTMEGSIATNHGIRRLFRHGNLRQQCAANTWALVLAAGDGTRLHSLTTSQAGIPIPKQFYSLRTGPSLLEEALRRGSMVARHAHLCTVVAHQHQNWWTALLPALSSDNIIVQPENRGTANGILLPLLRIMERDPDANIVLLPSDHFIEDEITFAESLRKAVTLVDRRPDDVVVLGIEPDQPDPELGYILPTREDSGGSFRVARFIEKPSAEHARELVDQGSLWNAFIVAARARVLLSLFQVRIPEIVMKMITAVQHDLKNVSSSLAINHLYTQLPTIDFSRHIMQGQEARLRVLPVPRCGWNDLGTPKRVEAVLKRVPDVKQTKMNSLEATRNYCLSLATQLPVGKKAALHENQDHNITSVATYAANTEALHAESL